MTTSSPLARERTAVLPHGVTGSGRAIAPVFRRARGPWIEDVDGRRFVDLHGGYGTAILGYGHPEVDAAVTDAIADGRSFVGCAHLYEAALAERLVDLLPEAERVALCGGGGTDALYHAVRLARAATGRELVVKVEGGYQGWHGVLGASTTPALDDTSPTSTPPTIPNSAGTLPAVLGALRAVTVNDPASLEERFAAEGDAIAALVVEPVLFSAGTVEVDADWLRLARELCDRHGALLIYDEIISGFRERVGGAAVAPDVRPDLATYGKAIANGHVIAVLTGRGDLLDQLAPGGPVFYSGTFNGHPLACAAAQATLDVLERDPVHETAGALAASLAAQVNDAARALGARAVCQQRGTGFTVYLGTTSVRDYRDVARACTPTVLAANDALRAHLLEHGVFLQLRRGTNRGFVSGAHEPAHVDQAAEAFVSFLSTAAAAEAVA